MELSVSSYTLGNVCNVFVKSVDISIYIMAYSSCLGVDGSLALIDPLLYKFHLLLELSSTFFMLALQWGTARFIIKGTFCARRVKDAIYWPHDWNPYPNETFSFPWQFWWILIHLLYFQWKWGVDGLQYISVHLIVVRIHWSGCWIWLACILIWVVQMTRQLRSIS